MHERPAEVARVRGAAVGGGIPVHWGGAQSHGEASEGWHLAPSSPCKKGSNASSGWHLALPGA